MLLPALTKVREITRRTVCMANERSMSAAFMGFVAMRDGRFPNKAYSPYEPRGYPLYSGTGPWLPVWENLLNREWYKQNKLSYYPDASDRWKDEPTCGPLLRFWYFQSETYYPNSQLGKRWLMCTSYRYWSNGASSNDGSRQWIANRMVTGGADWETGGAGSYNSWPGQYGKRINPKTISPYYEDYVLGTPPEVFKSPATKYMVFEGERGSDITHQGSDGPNGGVITLRDPAYPDRVPWSGQDGTFSFRHMLPSDVRLYQTNAQATVLYVDGHAGILTPNSPVSLGKRFMPEM
jgi:prepilin-type processing-associated H-X9-DG protein